MLPGRALQPESRDLRTVVAEDRRTKGPGVMGDLSEKTCPRWRVQRGWCPGRVKRRYCGNTEWIRRREGGWRRPGRQDKKSLPGILLAGT